MVGCAMRTKMPTGRYLHGAHGAPYFDKTLNLLALSLTLFFYSIHPTCNSDVHLILYLRRSSELQEKS